MINWSKLIKAALGLIVVLVLATMVYNWYGDFKAASLSAAASRPTTQTVDANASGITTGAAGTTYAVVKIDGVNFRVKPTSRAKVIRGLNKGETVTVLAKEGQWYQIKDRKGKMGWVTSSSEQVQLKAK